MASRPAAGDAPAAAAAVAAPVAGAADAGGAAADASEKRKRPKTKTKKEIFHEWLEEKKVLAKLVERVLLLLYHEERRPENPIMFITNALGGVGEDCEMQSHRLKEMQSTIEQQQRELAELRKVERRIDPADGKEYTKAKGGTMADGQPLSQTSEPPVPAAKPVPKRRPVGRPKGKKGPWLRDKPPPCTECGKPPYPGCSGNYCINTTCSKHTKPVSRSSRLQTFNALPKAEQEKQEKKKSAHAGKAEQLGDSEKAIILGVIKWLTVAGLGVSAEDVAGWSEEAIREKVDSWTNTYTDGTWLQKIRQQLHASNLSWRRIGTDKVKHPLDKEECEKFVHLLCWLIFEYKVPPELVINVDETFLHCIGALYEAWLEKGGAGAAVASRDKRGVTGTLAVSLAGRLCACQLVVKGVPGGTARIPGTVDIGEADFEFVQSMNPESAWQNNKTFKELLLAIVRYCDKVKKAKGLRPDQVAIVVMDNYKAHVLAVEKWRLYVDGEPRWLVVVFLPPNQTAHLQPLDCGVMGPFKSCYKSRRRRRISSQFLEQWREGKAPEDTTVDVTWTFMKLTFMEDLEHALRTINKKSLITSSWRKAGLDKCTAHETWVEACRSPALLNRGRNIRKELPTE
eukprot:gene43919-45544_t